MAEELIGNVLVAQSGGPTAVVNASLAGVITEALNHECMEEIYGGINGVQGILLEDLADLAEESQQAIRGLRSTPGCALGTCRFRLKKQPDYDRFLQVLAAHNIRYYFPIGGAEAMESAERLAQLARERHYTLRIIGVPKALDNSLVHTEHCPGYGSVIKYVATTVREIALDNQALGQHDLVQILEVMGRSSGWIAAGASLAKRREFPNDPPHIICLPETPFNPEKFVEDVRRTLKKERYCFIVAGEGLVDPDGNYLTIDTKSEASSNAAPVGVAEYLKGILTENLDVKIRTAKLGLAQRAATHCSSLSDNNEAFLAGQAAVRAAVAGESDRMVTLLRGDGDHYTCETGLTPLSEVAVASKPLPAHWINEDGASLSFQYQKYAQPLIQGEVAVPFENGLPKFADLAFVRVQKTLEPYEITA